MVHMDGDAARERARFNMVEQQIRTWEVLDQDVLDRRLGPHDDPARPGEPGRNVVLRVVLLVPGEGNDGKLRRAGHNPAKELNERLMSQMAAAPRGL